MAHCAVYQGVTPVLADIDPGTLLVDPADVEAKITPRTRVIIAVDYAGQPCDYDTLQWLAKRFTLALVADACHPLGGNYKGRAVSTLADLSVSSIHPVKARRRRDHHRGFWGRLSDAVASVTTESLPDHFERAQQDSWLYEVVDLGYNYRLNDFQCALGTLTTVNGSVPVPDFAPTPRRL